MTQDPCRLVVVVGMSTRTAESGHLPRRPFPSQWNEAVRVRERAEGFLWTPEQTPASSVASSLAPPLRPCRLLTFNGDTSSELQAADGGTALLCAVLSPQRACGRGQPSWRLPCRRWRRGLGRAVSASTLESPLPRPHRGQDPCPSKSTHSCWMDFS